MQSSLPPLHWLALGARGLALDESRSVPTKAKRDAEGLDVDVRTFLGDTRAVVASVEREVVFEPELAEEARMLIGRGAQLAEDALAVDDEGRRALQAAVEEVRENGHTPCGSPRAYRTVRDTHLRLTLAL